jgi:hypothetical protein
MGKRLACAAAVFFVLVIAASALTWELGGIAGGGLGFAYGSYFDYKASALADLGSTTPGELGTSQAELFPHFTIGGYVEAGFLEWLGVRAELRASLLGASFMAYTDAGDPIDRYGFYSFAAILPIYIRGALALGPGSVSVSAGGFCGAAFSGFVLVDRYLSISVTTSVEPRLDRLLFFGVSGGFGYSLPLGPGIAAVELRADWTLAPADGESNSGINPLGTAVAVSYGVRIGGEE